MTGVNEDFLKVGLQKARVSDAAAAAKLWFFWRLVMYAGIKKDEAGWGAAVELNTSRGAMQPPGTGGCGGRAASGRWPVVGGQPAVIGGWSVVGCRSHLLLLGCRSATGNCEWHPWQPWRTPLTGGLQEQGKMPLRESDESAQRTGSRIPAGDHAAGLQKCPPYG